MFEVKLLESLTALASFGFVLYHLNRIETKTDKQIYKLENRIYKLEK